jgi:hypothetical protein
MEAEISSEMIAMIYQATPGYLPEIFRTLFVQNFKIMG